MSLKSIQNQEESKVSFNVIDDKEAFSNQIKNGEYDKVLSKLSTLNIHPRKLVDFYELVSSFVLSAKFTSQGTSTHILGNQN